jgi:Predicted membrane protein/domain
MKEEKGMDDIFEEGIIEKAGVGKRFVSCLIDGIILGVVALIILLAVNVIILVPAAILGPSGLTALVVISDLLGTAISVAYFTYLFGRGQTLGMMGMKIKLTRTDGTYPIGYTRGFLRYVGTIISALVIGIGYLWIVIDKDNQGWHDKIADTYVVSA